MPTAAPAPAHDGRSDVPLPQASGHGLTVALSRAQLAAVLERATAEPGGSLGNRLIGGLRLIGFAAFILTSHPIP